MESKAFAMKGVKSAFMEDPSLPILYKKAKPNPSFFWRKYLLTITVLTRIADSPPIPKTTLPSTKQLKSFM